MKPPSCSRCGTGTALFDTWGFWLCAPCHGLWLKTPELRVGEHWPSAPEHFTNEGHARYVAEATRRTAAWVRGGR